MFCFNFLNYFSFSLETSRTPLLEQFSFWPLTMFTEKLHRGFSTGSKYPSVLHIFLTNQGSSFYTSLYFYIRCF